MKTIIFSVRRPLREPLRIPLLCSGFSLASWRGVPVLRVDHPVGVNFPFQKVACVLDDSDPPAFALFSAFDVARVEHGRCLPVPGFPGSAPSIPTQPQP